ncbi:MAG: Gfo/Idh/MocA family protein [Fimbriiglobus sp.]
MSDRSRRDFLKISAALGATAFAAPAIQAQNVNEKLNIGVIGSGNRGRTIASLSLKQGHNIVALCDIAEFRFDAMQKLITDAGQDEAKTYSDHRKLLEHKGLDAVIIASPDHHHKTHLLATMGAEKHAYIEKPLTKSIDEGQEMIEAVAKANKIVQVGNQRHSGPHWEEAARAVNARAFGKLVWAKVWDCRNWIKRDPFAVPKDFKFDPKKFDWEGFLGNAPKRPFDAHRYWSWRWYWDYAGGMMTDIGAHQLDIVAWLGGAEVPKSVVANGGRYYFDRWETPDVVHGVWDYGKFAANFAIEFINGADGVGAAFYGTKQTLICDADKDIKLYDTIDKITPEIKPIATWKVEPEAPLHVKNWIECIKSGDAPNSTVALGHRVILAAHLANMSYRTGKKIFWDAERNEIIGT